MLTTIITLAFLITTAAVAAVIERTTGPSASWANPVNRNLLRIASCETGYGGPPNWRHHNGIYTGGLGFAHSTWTYYRRFVRPMPTERYARDASPAEQLAVGRVLVRIFGGYSSWPTCGRRLGLPQ